MRRPADIWLVTRLTAPLSTALLRPPLSNPPTHCPPLPPSGPGLDGSRRRQLRGALYTQNTPSKLQGSPVGGHPRRSDPLSSQTLNICPHYVSLSCPCLTHLHRSLVVGAVTEQEGPKRLAALALLTKRCGPPTRPRPPPPHPHRRRQRPQVCRRPSTARDGATRRPPAARRWQPNGAPPRPVLRALPSRPRGLAQPLGAPSMCPLIKFINQNAPSSARDAALHSSFLLQGPGPAWAVGGGVCEGFCSRQP
jgi:hypothetical protein